MTAQEMVSRVRELPRLPQATIQLTRMLGREDDDNEEVVKVIRQDMTLTAKLLRVCNSAHAAAREPITSVDEAVFRLGRAEIMRAAWALSLQGALTKPLDGYAASEGELWQHAMTTAFAAEVVAKETVPGCFEPSTAFTAGLLHDIGKVVFNQSLSAPVQKELRVKIDSGEMSRSEAERAVLGTDHAEVGALLLAQWKLPDALVEATAHHHTPVAVPEVRLSALVHVANFAVHAVGASLGWESYAERAHEEVMDRLGVSGEQFERLCARVFEAMDQIKPFLEKA